MDGAQSWLIGCHFHGFMGQWHELGLGSTPVGGEAELVCRALVGGVQKAGDKGLNLPARTNS